MSHINYKSATFISQLPSTTIYAQSCKDPPATVILRTQPVFIFCIILSHRVASVILTPSTRTKKSDARKLAPYLCPLLRTDRLVLWATSVTTQLVMNLLKYRISSVSLCGEQQIHYEIILNPKYYTIWHPRCLRVLSCHGFSVFFFLGLWGM